GGTGTQWEIVRPDDGTLTTDLKLKTVSHSAGMIILSYEIRVHRGGRSVYTGSTYFGFFQRTALAQQVGIPEAKPCVISAEKLARGRRFGIPHDHPFPDARWRMLDRIEPYLPNGGSSGLGFLRGKKQVNPDDWFFQAHFLNDPVWPGSLGLEAFLQLLQVAVTEHWPDWAGELHHIDPGRPHSWIYRGQVIPTNREIEVDADITEIDNAKKRITANGYLSVDGRVIYAMKGFTLQG